MSCCQGTCVPVQCGRTTDCCPKVHLPPLREAWLHLLKAALDGRTIPDHHRHLQEEAPWAGALSSRWAARCGLPSPEAVQVSSRGGGKARGRNTRWTSLQMDICGHGLGSPGERRRGKGQGKKRAPTPLHTRTPRGAAPTPGAGLAHF